MNPFDFSDVADNNTDKLRDLLREYILTSSTKLHGELVTTDRIRQYIGTGQVVEVNETESIQYSSVIQTHDSFVDTDAGTALLTYLAETHDFEPSTPYLTNLLQHAFRELGDVTVEETGTRDENVQELHVTVTNDDESLRDVVDECVQILTADINEQHQYTLRLALGGVIVERGPVEITDTHRLRELDDGLLLGEKRVSNTAPETKRGKNVKSWTAAAEIDMSTNHAFSDAPPVAAEFLAVTLSLFSQSWIAVKNAYSVKRSFHMRMNTFPAPGVVDASLAEIKPEHAAEISELLELLRLYCDGSTTLRQSSPYFIRELFTSPINLALHHYGEAIIRSELPQSSIGRILFGLEALYMQNTEEDTSSRDVARYAAFTIGQATSSAVSPDQILTDIADAYHYRNQWAHGDQTGEIAGDLQERLFGYLRCAIVVFAWIDTHTGLMTPHLDIESAFIDESVRGEFVAELNGLELTDYLTRLPENDCSSD